MTCRQFSGESCVVGSTKVVPVRAFSDNYVWTIRDGSPMQRSSAAATAVQRTTDQFASSTDGMSGLFLSVKPFMSQTAF